MKLKGNQILIISIVLLTICSVRSFSLKNLTEKIPEPLKPKVEASKNPPKTGNSRADNALSIVDKGTNVALGSKFVPPPAKAALLATKTGIAGGVAFKNTGSLKEAGKAAGGAGAEGGMSIAKGYVNNPLAKAGLTAATMGTGIATDKLSGKDKDNSSTIKTPPQDKNPNSDDSSDSESEADDHSSSDDSSNSDSNTDAISASKDRKPTTTVGSRKSTAGYNNGYSYGYNGYTSPWSPQQTAITQAQRQAQQRAQVQAYGQFQSQRKLRKYLRNRPAAGVLTTTEF